MSGVVRRRGVAMSSERWVADVGSRPSSSAAVSDVQPQRPRSAAPALPRGRPEPESDQRVQLAVAAIRALPTQDGLVGALAVGEIVTRILHDGDVSAWHSRARKHGSLRQISRGLGGGPFANPAALCRCLAAYELLHDRASVSTLKHLSISHVSAALRAPDRRCSIELLERAERERWSVRQLSARARPAGPARGVRLGAADTLARAEELAAGARALRSHLRDLPAPAQRDQRERIFAAIMEARAELDAAQSLAHPRRRC